MGERHGRQVAVDFGSVTTEEAVCRGRVGLGERSDRAMLEIRGVGPDVDRALAELTSMRDHAWWARLSPPRAIVRCEAPDEDACVAVLRRVEDVAVVDVAPDHVALTLVGPLADAVLRASQVEEEDDVIVVRRNPISVELLASRQHGPALWYRLLEAGEEFEIACVGVDATEHLEVSDHMGALRRV
jgi:glycine cleavage system aminomethyltransferase T